MNPRPDHARELRFALTDPRALCEKLGLLADRKGWMRQAGGVVVRCPVHEDRTPSCSVRIGPDGTVQVRCHGCQWGGDALTLIGAALGLKNDFRGILRAAAGISGEWSILAELEGAQPDPNRPPVRAPPPDPILDRDYPPQSEVDRLWRESGLCTEDPAVSARLESRHLSPDGIDARELARAIPDRNLPRWAVCRGGNWHEQGYRLVVPMFDASGTMRSFRAWCVTDGEGPKRLPPFGHKATGLVMADEFGKAMLTGTRAPERVVICEGEPDYLSWATRVNDPTTAVLGIVTGSWSSAFAERMPIGATVIIRTDSDAAGEKYAREIANTLRGRCFLRRAA